AWATTMKVEVRNGVHVPDSKSITVREAGERWIAAAERDGLQRATIAGYRQHLAHIVPHLGSIKLSQLSVSDVEAFETKLLAGTPRHGTERVNPRSAYLVGRISTSLGSSLAVA